MPDANQTDQPPKEGDANPTEPGPAAGAAPVGGENSVEAASTETDKPASLKDHLDMALESGKVVIEESLKATITDVLGHSRQTLKVLLEGSQITDEQKQMVAQVYSSAEDHAVNGRSEQAKQMVKRAMNFLRSDELVMKANRIEAMQNYFSGVLEILSGGALSFASKFGNVLADKADDLAGSAMEAIFGK